MLRRVFIIKFFNLYEDPRHLTNEIAWQWSRDIIFNMVVQEMEMVHVHETNTRTDELLIY